MIGNLPSAGKTAVVNGDRGGIGQAVCRRLAQEGALVFSKALSCSQLISFLGKIK